MMNATEHSTIIGFRDVKGGGNRLYMVIAHTNGRWQANGEWFDHDPTDAEVLAAFNANTANGD